jgi:C4-type Zn-finger protein
MPYCPFCKNGLLKEVDRDEEIQTVYPVIQIGYICRDCNKRSEMVLEFDRFETPDGELIE